MQFTLKGIWGAKQKAVPVINTLEENTREGLHKAFIPRFLYKPPYGYPRFSNVGYTRWLAKSAFPDMAINTIIDEICSIPWDIVLNPILDEKLDDENERAQIKNFFLNPNSNEYDTFEDIFIKMPLRDVLEINTSAVIKVFNRKEQMVEVTVGDGGTFTKNPDIHGMMTNREEIIYQKDILSDEHTGVRGFNPITEITSAEARSRAAYFQFGWVSGPIPVPFGKREVVWLQRNRRSDDIYGFSPIQILSKSLQTLLYYIDSDLDYFNNNNVPKGIIGLENSDADEMQGFKEQWNEQQRTRDELGNWRKLHHKVPIVNRKPFFERIEFSSADLQLLEKTKLWSKMVWGSFGVTTTEMGFTEDISGQSNMIVQSKVFKKKAVLPNVRLLENSYNRGILPEFEYMVSLNIGKEKPLIVPKYLFKFQIEDVDEKKTKQELVNIQLEGGYRYINELRAEEGLEEVDWGNEPYEKQSANSFNFGMNEDQNTNPKERNASSEPSKNDGKEDDKEGKQNKKSQTLPGKFASGKKAQGTFVNPLLLKENEKPTSEKRIANAIKFVVGKNKDKLLNLVTNEMRNSKIKNLKSLEAKGLPEIITGLKGILAFQGMKAMVNEVIKNNFLKGWDDSEKILNQNFVPDSNAIDFIATHTFENVKGMTEDLSNKLRQELERSLINGESITQIKSKLTNIFDKSDARIEAIARTETNRAFNQGRLLAMKKSGIAMRKWDLITDDTRTSEVSKAMGRKYGSPEKSIPLDEEFSAVVNGKTFSGQAPPFHVNERDKVMFVEQESFEEKSQVITDLKFEMALKEQKAKINERKEKLIKKLEGKVDE